MPGGSNSNKGTQNSDNNTVQGKVVFINNTPTAPTNAQYVVTSPDATLTAERVTTNNAEIIWNVNTPAQLSADIGAIAIAKVTGLSAALTNLTTPEYVVTSANATLTAERVTTSNAEVVWNTATPGTLSADIGVIAQSKVTGLVTDLANKYIDLYGDGSDGNLTVVGTTTLTNTFLYDTITIQAAGILKPAGYRIYARTLVIDVGGKIDDSGNAGVAGVAGAGLGVRGYFGAFSGAGATGVATTTAGSNAGSAQTLATPLRSDGVQPTGGNGGASASNAGGIGRVSTAATLGRKSYPHMLEARFANTQFSCGAGGGSGGNVIPSTSGAGGGGGGMVWVAAKSITNNGSICANGGNGGNATLNAGTSSGGGGGGSGGIVMIIYNTTTGTGVIEANGGTGGALAGTGLVGLPGSVGCVNLMRN